MTERVNKALRQLARREQRIPVMTGVVSAVNGMLCDVRPSDGGAEMYDVRLKVSATDQELGAVAVPVVGSPVIMAMLNGDANAWTVVHVERIERWFLQLPGKASIEALPSGEVHLNGQSFGGIIKVQELRAELAKVNTFLLTLRSTITGAVPVAGDGGAAIKTALASALQSLQLPTYTNIESPKTKHGGV